jgi:hypothetical protein
VLRNEQHLNIGKEFDHQISLSESKIWYFKNCLHFSKCPGSLIPPRVKINIPLCYHKALVGKRSIGVVFQKLLTTVP